MKLATRKLLDTSFTAYGIFSIVLMTLALLMILIPVFVRGSGAFVFRGTVEYRRLELEKFERGNEARVAREREEYNRLRQPLYEMLDAFENELRGMDRDTRDEYRTSLRAIKNGLRHLLGPRDDEPVPVMVRDQYGQVRWNRARVKLNEILFEESWDYSDRGAMGVRVLTRRDATFRGTAMEDFFSYLERHFKELLAPRLVFYPQFLTDRSYDSHIFGGIWAEMLGTLYLALGSMLFAVPIGVIAAIYLTEYAKQGIVVSVIRTCVSTLAGVPSIVFGLFGLSFFILTIGVSESKSVLAGSMTLALLILPTVIRASEEAIRAVPHTYKEAALSLGSGKWHTVLTVILPAALPGILTGIVISMGRAAGETAPIIFTAAVSVGRPLTLLQTLTQPTPALPWNIYNLSTEHEAVDEIRHVQFGMVMVLISLVLLLNVTAIILRARISKKLKG